MRRDAEKCDTPTIGWGQLRTWQRAYKEIIPQTYLDTLSVDARRERWDRTVEENRNNGKNSLFVAVVDEKVVGFMTAD